MSAANISYASIEVAGGLGNQLFMIAALLHYVKICKGRFGSHGRIDKEIVFEYRESLYHRHNLPRKTFWHSLFKDQFTVLSHADFEALECKPFCEKYAHAFQELPYNYEKNILLRGYYQSFRYIKDDIRQKMIQYIFSNSELVNEAKKHYTNIKEFFGPDTHNNDMISIHVRRTDFTVLKDYNYNLGLDYYQQALKIANKKKIVVFSDDISWCKSNINEDVFECDSIYFVDINNVEIEFLLMSMYQHNVIANSTFSLWASFISTYDEPKIIIAPKQWYAENGPKTWNEVYHKYITHII
jgi:hypothetical protein